MQDELLYSLFQPGKTVTIQRTENVNAIQYVGKSLRVMMADATGALAQLAQTADFEPAKVLFVPFDGTTTFAFVAPGFSKYSQVLPTTLVVDLETLSQTPMSEFYPAFFQAPAPQPAPAPVPGAPVQAPAPEPDPRFQVGTVFQFATTTNPALSRYLGRIFQITHADGYGVLALPERNSGLSEAVYFPFDGTSDFTLNPPGTFSFASGIGAGQQVYNPVTSSYVVVEEFAPSYGFFWDPFPVVYYDTYVPFGVVYDPYWVDPYGGYYGW